MQEQYRNLFSRDFCRTRSQLHRVTGVYFIYDDTIQYIGKSINLAERCISSMQEKNLHQSIDVKIGFWITTNPTDAALLEIVAIAEYKPPLNGDTYNLPSVDINIPFLNINPIQVWDHDRFHEFCSKRFKNRDQQWIENREAWNQDF